jgi:hypothetical protein
MFNIKFYGFVMVSLLLFGCAAAVEAPSRYEDGQILEISPRHMNLIEPDPHYVMPQGPVKAFTAETIIPPQISA